MSPLASGGILALPLPWLLSGRLSGRGRLGPRSSPSGARGRRSFGRRPGAGREFF